MPVTWTIAQRIGHGGLAGLTIIHINHLLDDVLELNEILLSLGANLIYVPIIYGAHELPMGLPYTSIYALREHNSIGLYRDSKRIAPASSTFEEAIKAAIQDALVAAAKHTVCTENSKLLIIEDGGYHYDVLYKLNGAGPDLSHIIGVVEQTMAGVRQARYHQAVHSASAYPILSIARSRIKTRFENYFIARRVVEETAQLLYEFEEFLAFRDVILIGYGTIGRPIASLLKKLDCLVTVIESDPQVRQTAQHEGFETLETVSPAVFETSPIVMGNTGTAAVTLEMLIAFLESSADSLYLVSSSSRRTECSQVINFFEGTSEHQQALVEQYSALSAVKDVAIVKTSSGLQYLFTYHGQVRQVVLLAEGYPVNFYRPQSQSLPARVIDPINAEILMLVRYLYQHHSGLHNELYLLGHDHLLDLGEQEDEILALWAAVNRVSPKVLNSGAWPFITPHPDESWLAKHIMDV